VQSKIFPILILINLLRCVSDSKSHKMYLLALQKEWYGVVYNEASLSKTAYEESNTYINLILNDISYIQ